MFSGRDPIIEATLVEFITNLKPTIRSPRLVSIGLFGAKLALRSLISTAAFRTRLDKFVASVVDEFCRSPTERSIWWNEAEKRNVDPLAGTDGFFSMTWDTKVGIFFSRIWVSKFSCRSKTRISQLTILRQLVEWQLTHCTAIRGLIDTAWGVKAAKHTKKLDKQAVARPPPEDPNSYENLCMTPIGQDSSRKRYWIVDSKSSDEILYHAGLPSDLPGCGWNRFSSHLRVKQPLEIPLSIQSCFKHSRRIPYHHGRAQSQCS